jgi:cyclopropane-fatty-acyl-phospholipid synthase
MARPPFEAAGPPSRDLASGVAARLALLAEAGLVPDRLVRTGIRRMLAERLRELVAVPAAERALFVEECRKGPIALVPELANEQHYEVPPAFFAAVLGPRLKYSCAFFDDDTPSLGAAEERMLALTAERAGIADGMAILDLGCGWGSFSLWAAERFPASRVVAVSNSAPQRRFLVDRARERGLYNVTVTTADVNRFEAQGRFDRVVSIEMFEHVRNHERLLARIRRWLAPEGRLFVHHFCHREHAYPYVDRGPGDWMARHFFSGGMMPSEGWLAQFADDLAVERQWRVPGTHYARTSEAWLARLDAQRERVQEILAPVYGADARRWLHRWRLFFLACAELFAYRGGEEWFVTHLLLAPGSDLRA